MTPSQEKKVLKDIKDLLALNAELDAKQERDIAGLEKRIKALEKKAQTPASARPRK